MLQSHIALAFMSLLLFISSNLIPSTAQELDVGPFLELRNRKCTIKTKTIATNGKKRSIEETESWFLVNDSAFAAELGTKDASEVIVWKDGRFLTASSDAMRGRSDAGALESPGRADMAIELSAYNESEVFGMFQVVGTFSSVLELAKEQKSFRKKSAHEFDEYTLPLPHGEIILQSGESRELQELRFLPRESGASTITIRFEYSKSGAGALTLKTVRSSKYLAFADTTLECTHTLVDCGDHMQISRYSDCLSLPDGTHINVTDMQGIDFVWENNEILRKFDKSRLDVLREGNFRPAIWQSTTIIYGACFVICLLVGYRIIASRSKSKVQR